jgi:hypothetical protein
MPYDWCLKGYKRDLDFYNSSRIDFKTYATGILETLLYKGIDADYHGSQTISIRMESR